MGSKWKLTPWLVAVLLLAMAVGCVTEEEVEKGKRVLTWDLVARAIDRQLGMISDGTGATCNGHGDEIAPGTHCKDQLQGRVTLSTVKQYIEVWYDSALALHTPFYSHGFMPRTMSPCVETLDGDTIPDYMQVCAALDGLSCKDDNGHLELVYHDCDWQDPVAGGDAWILNGKKDIYTYVTRDGEEVLIIRGTHASGVDQNNNATYDFSGDAVRYWWLNPFTGAPAEGTTGPVIDGMELMKINITVDMDGPGPYEAGNYNLQFANDYEDGFFFFTLPGAGVWLSNPGNAPLTLRFYQAGALWDNSPLGGCLVDILTVDPATRTFTYSSQGTYPNNGCIPDLNPPGSVSY